MAGYPRTFILAVILKVQPLLSFKVKLEQNSVDLPHKTGKVPMGHLNKIKKVSYIVLIINKSFQFCILERQFIVIVIGVLHSGIIMISRLMNPHSINLTMAGAMLTLRRINQEQTPKEIMFLRGARKTDSLQQNLNAIKFQFDYH